MKRFYCTVCKKVKRVRRNPDSLHDGFTSIEVINDREGQCRWHARSGNSTRAQVNDRGRTPHVNIKKSKSSKAPKPQRDDRKRTLTTA